MDDYSRKRSRILNEVIFLENQKAGKYNIYAYAQKKDGEKVILARQKKYIASSSLGNF